MWNPEFLREGFAVKDTLEPDRLVLGLDPSGQAGPRSVMRDVYRAARSTAGVPLVVMDYPTAELVKVAANSFLATKISFINAMAEVCEATGADVTMLVEGPGVRRTDRRALPQRGPRLRRRLPAQGHPRVHGSGR